jgi:hypothetical protein
MSLKAAVEYVLIGAFSGPDLGRLRFRLGFGVSRGSENVETPGRFFNAYVRKRLLNTSPNVPRYILRLAGGVADNLGSYN